jgi:thiol-disulfide isomerase/thioredoxin
MMNSIPSTTAIARLLLVGSCIALLVLPAAAQTGLALAPGDRAPDLAGYSIENEWTELPWEGLTLVNFWATWCEPCKIEMPKLQELQDEYGDQGFRVIGINRETDTAAELVEEFLAETGVTYPIYRQSLRQRWEGVNALPTSYLVNAEGVVLRKYVGALPKQTEGLFRDIDDVLHGREMQPMFIPEYDEEGRVTLR